MKPAFLFFAGALSLVGGIILWLGQNSRREKLAMAATPTSKAASIAQAVPGTLVEVKGTVRCQAPFTSDYTKTPAAYFRSEITQEVSYYATGSDGKRERKTRTEVRRRTERHALFYVEDDSGSVLVRSQSADIDAEKVYEESQPPEGYLDDYGTLSSAVQAGLTYREYVLFPDKAAYVLGTVQGDHSIGLHGPAATPENKVFLVSYKTEEKLARSASVTQILLTLAATLAFGLALFMLWLGVKQAL